MEITGLQKRIFIPLLIVFFTIAIVSVLLFINLTNSYNEREGLSRINRAKNMLNLKISDDTELMKSLIMLLEKNKEIEKAWLLKDRSLLLKKSRTPFRYFRSNYRVGNLYYHNIDRTNFLRVHRPEKYGDYIYRITMDRSFYEQAPASGLELNSAGELTLRVIKPWRINKKITGYIEIGENIDHLIQRIVNSLGVDLVILIKKEYIAKKDFNSLKRKRQLYGWNKLDNYVIYSTSFNQMGLLLFRGIEKHLYMHRGNPDILCKLRIGENIFNCGHIPLIDIGKRPIGEIFVLIDVTMQNKQMFLSISVFTGFLLLIIITLLLFFWKFFGKVEHEINLTHGENEAIVSSINSILIKIDINNIIISFNKIAEETFNISNKQISGRSIIDCPIEWDGKEIVHQINSAKKTGLPSGELEFIYYDRSKGSRTIGYKINPIYEDDKYSGCIILGSDITEKKNRRSQDMFRQKLMSIGELSSGIAHEINTPVQYVLNNTVFIKENFTHFQKIHSYIKHIINQYIKKNKKNDFIDKVKDYITGNDLDFLSGEIPDALDQSIEGLNHISKIVQTVKSFSHPDTEDKVPAHINEIINNIIILSKNEWKYTAEIVTDLDDDLPEIYCYPAEISQALLNIVINAAHAISQAVKENKYTSGKITIAAKKINEHIEINIGDDGAGIQEEIKNRIFDPFFTTKDIGEGTGQGLTIAYTIITERHHGKIYFKSKEGEGTNFFITLPVNKPGSQ